jgi:hypothetical protein
MPSVYQLRAVLRGVSPLIWRRLLVRSDTGIGALPASLQAAIGWSDTHLQRFRIHRKAYVKHHGADGKDTALVTAAARADAPPVRVVGIGVKSRTGGTFSSNLS